MSVLIIGKVEQQLIDEAIARAAANPVRWATMKDHVTADYKPTLSLAERTPAMQAKLVRPTSEHMMLGNVRVAYSHEEQPAGMFRHLSASVARPGRMPHPVAVEEICKAFHFDHFPPMVGRMWLEEFDPGHHAVNVIELIVSVEPGHA